MGKKSRRQREGGAATGFLKPHKRFEDKHWRHKDGSPISDDETFELYMLLRTLPELREVREMGLQEHSTKDDAAQQRRHEYMSLVVQKKLVTKGMPGAIEAWKRWPRLQPHWPRIRRRICDQCSRRLAGRIDHKCGAGFAASGAATRASASRPQSRYPRPW